MSVSDHFSAYIMPEHILMKLGRCVGILVLALGWLPEIYLIFSFFFFFFFCSHTFSIVDIVIIHTLTFKSNHFTGFDKAINII